MYILYQQKEDLLKKLILFQGKGDYLEALKTSVEIHGTVYIDTESKNKTGTIPPYVINHGILNGEDLHTLLRQSKVSFQM